MSKKYKHLKKDCTFYEYGDIAPKAYGAFCVYGPVTPMTANLCKNCNRYKERGSINEC